MVANAISWVTIVSDVVRATLPFIKEEYIEDIWPPGAHIITIIPIAIDWESINKLVIIPTIGRSVIWIKSPTIELFEFVNKFLKLSMSKSVPTPIINNGIR